MKEEGSISSQFQEGEDGAKYTQLVTDAKLGPAGTSAVMMALLGTSHGMSGEPYVEMKSIRMWESCISDDGARAVVCYNIKLTINTANHYKQFDILLMCNLGSTS